MYTWFIMVKCIIERYDPAVKKPPFTMLKVDECEIDDSNINTRDWYADKFYEICYRKKLSFRFWSMSSEPGYKYAIVVD